MSKQVHKIIERLYEKKREDAQFVLESRKREIFNKIPLLEGVETEIVQLGLKYNRQILMGNSVSGLLGELSTRIEELKKQKEQILKDFELPSDYLQVIYTCKICKDYGFIQIENGYTQKCACYRQEVINNTYSKSNLSNIQNQNFKNFNETIYNDEMNEQKYGMCISPRQNIVNILKQSQEFIKNIEDKKQKGLFFIGPTGVGKTFMSYCIGSELMNKGMTVLYLTAPQLFNIIKDYRTASWESEGKFDIDYNYIMDTDFLIIDDLGIEPVTAARYSELLTILTTRASNDNKKICKTLISTNLSLRKINENYTERVASRIVGDFIVFKFIGDDLRLKINKQ